MINARWSNSHRITAERRLRALPQWFGLEQPLLEYVAQSALLPTFIACSRQRGRLWRYY
jgi:hypothetical protein